MADRQKLGNESKKWSCWLENPQRASQAKIKEIKWEKNIQLENPKGLTDNKSYFMWCNKCAHFGPNQWI